MKGLKLNGIPPPSDPSPHPYARRPISCSSLTIHGLGPPADVLVQLLQVLGELPRLLDHLVVPGVARGLPVLVVACAETQRLLYLSERENVRGAQGTGTGSENSE